MNARATVSLVDGDAVVALEEVGRHFADRLDEAERHLEYVIIDATARIDAAKAALRIWNSRCEITSTAPHSPYHDDAAAHAAARLEAESIAAGVLARHAAMARTTLRPVGDTPAVPVQPLPRPIAARVEDLRQRHTIVCRWLAGQGLPVGERPRSYRRGRAR